MRDWHEVMPDPRDLRKGSGKQALSKEYLCCFLEGLFCQNSGKNSNLLLLSSQESNGMLTSDTVLCTTQ